MFVILIHDGDVGFHIYGTSTGKTFTSYKAAREAAMSACTGAPWQIIEVRCSPAIKKGPGRGGFRKKKDGT